MPDRRPAAAPVPILMYHEVSSAPHPAFRRYTVTARAFRRQMQWLADSGYRSIDMDTLVRARQGLISLPDRPVVLTFDDGFRSCGEHALPVLREHGFTAIFYLVSGLMGETSRWLLPELGIELPIMTWDTARELVAAGFQCGAHTVTHPRLPGLHPLQCRSELVDARARLESELGRPVVHLAYPYGAFDQAVREIAAESGYVSACSTRSGFSEVEDDRLALHRISVYGHDSLHDFTRRLGGSPPLWQRVGQAFVDVAGRLRPGAGSRP